MKTTRKTITLGEHVRLTLLFGARKEWLGIGDIRVDGVALRDGRHPMVVRLDTPDGWLYTRFFLESASEKKSGAATFRFRAVGVPWGRQEFMDEYDQNLLAVGMPRGEVEDTLTLTLAPVAERIGGRTWHGFAHSFEFRSAKRRIHRLLLDGSWELGGSVAGNTLFHQGQCNMPVWRGAKRSLFTTTCLKTLEQYGSPQGVSYQLAPRGGLIQAFDFQHGRAGALLHYWPRFESISSVVESPAGSTRLFVSDEHRFPLSRRAATPAQRVLFAAGRLAEHEARDLWWTAHEHVYGGIRKAHGVTATVVRPEMGLKYSTRVTDGGLKMTVGGVEVDSREVPYAIAEHVLPRLAAAGIRRFFPEVMSESDVTALGMKRKLDAGVHGDLHCSSVCATHRFLPSEFWGGLPAWRHMADRARALGIEIGAWFAPHLSPRSPIFAEHPEYRMIDVNSLAAGGGYTAQCIVSADWNTGIYDWALDDLMRWQSEGGLDYLFTDSWANLGLVQMNYSAGMRTSLRRLAQLYHDIQTRVGVKVFTFEGISPFGASRFGLADLRGDLLDAQGGIVGQNDFGWWVRDMDMAYGICLCAHPRKRTEEEVKALQFRAMSARGYIMPDALCGPLYDVPAWCVELNLIYEQALPDMKTRRMLPDGRGIQWENGANRIVWAYSNFECPAPAGAKIERLTGAGVEASSGGGVLRAKGGCVYRLAST